MAKMRLDKLLSHMGLGSRKELKGLAKQGAISVNGTIVKDSGLQVDPDHDNIAVNGERIVYREFIYIMLNKPQGVISATENMRDRTVIDLLPSALRHFDPFPVGRLDKDTEGLLLLTNDGQLAHELLSPKKHVPKTYWAEIEGVVGQADIIRFQEGVTLEDGYLTKPASLNILSTDNEKQTSCIELTITEGKFHQVKRMFEAVGKKVTFLKRLSMGSLRLDEQLTPGQFRECTSEEIEALRKREQE